MDVARKVLADMDREDAYGAIFDKADALTETKRRTSSSSKNEAPNTSRVENMTASKDYGAARTPVEAVYFYFLFWEDDKSYADAISRALFNGATIHRKFDTELRKLGIDVKSTGARSDAFAFGGVAVSLVYNKDARRLDFPQPDVDSMFEDGRVLAFEALNWTNGVSGFFGRTDKLEELREWAEDPDPRAKLRLINGPGGVGKTRLAAMLADRLELKGWKVGFLPSHVKSVETSFVFAGGGIGTLLIVDYPEERPRLVQSLFEAVSGDQNYTVPVRILLVSRESEDAWRQSTNTRLKRLTTTSLELSGPLSLDDALELVDTSAILLTEHLGRSDIDLSAAEA